MSRHTRRGFTLIELLVVITVIGMLMALLLPAISAVKETMRLRECASNMSQLSKAMLVLVNNNTNQHFPGYSNLIYKPGGVASTPVSWGVMLLPFLEQDQVYQQIRGGDRTVSAQPYLGVFNCPSNPPENFTSAFSSMVVNCGKSDTTKQPGASAFVPDTKANGIFFDKSSAAPIDFRMADVKDGQSTTVMITENVNCSSWAANFSTAKGPTETQIGFLWWDNEFAANSTTTKLPWRKINGYKTPDPTASSGSPQAGPDDLARPSSNHSGGVNANFCDNHTIWLRDDIAYFVYQQLMTPWGEQATPIAVDTTKGNPAPPYFLSEGDFR